MMVFFMIKFSLKKYTSTNPRQQLKDAVKESFGQWAKKVVFMGADSFELTSSDIELVFSQLKSSPSRYSTSQK